MKKNNIYWGMIFLIIAVLIVVNGFGLIDGIGVWSVIFSVFFGAMLLDGIVKLQPTSILFSLAFLAIVWAEPLHIESITPWPVLISATLGSVGLRMIFGKRKKDKKWKEYSANDTNFVHGGATVEEDSNEIVTCESKFAGTVKYITSNNLQKVYVRNEFSGMSIYLDKAIVPSRRVEMVVQNSFGGLEIYVPANWMVENHMNNTLAGMDEEGRKAPTDADSVTLVISGNSNFAGITIKYI